MAGKKWLELATKHGRFLPRVQPSLDYYLEGYRLGYRDEYSADERWSRSTARGEQIERSSSRADASWYLEGVDDGNEDGDEDHWSDAPED